MLQPPERPEHERVERCLCPWQATNNRTGDLRCELWIRVGGDGACVGNKCEQYVAWVSAAEEMQKLMSGDELITTSKMPT